MTRWFIYAPINGFLLKLHAGWRFQDVCEPMPGPHGRHAVLMWRSDDPR
jgi:hypothetical protein